MRSDPFVLITVDSNGVSEVSLGARTPDQEVGSLNIYAKIRSGIRALDRCLDSPNDARTHTDMGAA